MKFIEIRESDGTVMRAYNTDVFNTLRLFQAERNNGDKEWRVTLDGQVGQEMIVRTKDAAKARKAYEDVLDFFTNDEKRFAFTQLREV